MFIVHWYASNHNNSLNNKNITLIKGLLQISRLNIWLKPTELTIHLVTIVSSKVISSSHIIYLTLRTRSNELKVLCFRAWNKIHVLVYISICFFTSHLVQDRLPPSQLHYSRSVALFHTDMSVCLLEVPWQGWCVGGYLWLAWISAAAAGQQRWRHPPRRWQPQAPHSKSFKTKVQLSHRQNISNYWLNVALQWFTKHWLQILNYRKMWYLDMFFTGLKNCAK